MVISAADLPSLVCNGVKKLDFREILKLISIQENLELKNTANFPLFFSAPLFYVYH